MHLAVDKLITPPPTDGATAKRKPLPQPPTNDDEVTAGSALEDFVSLAGKIRPTKKRVEVLKDQILKEIPVEEDCPQVRARIAQNYAQVINRARSDENIHMPPLSSLLSNITSLHNRKTVR